MKLFYFVGLTLGIFMVAVNVAEFDLQNLLMSILITVFFFFNLALEIN